MSHLGKSSGKNYDKDDLSLVVEALEELLGDDDRAHVKVGYIKNRTPLSSTAAGKHLATLREESDQYEISKWGRSDTNPTWIVERVE